MSDIKSDTQTTVTIPSKDVVEDVTSLQPTVNTKRPTLHVAAQPPANTAKEEYHPETNILFLGETGAGKSTFINAFVNYLTFSTLEQAISGQLIGLAPIKFTVSDDSFEAKVIKFGYKPNESQLTEQTATQGAKDYLFYLNGEQIRLIDTPGIEAKNDKKFEDVLQHISQFKELHAICIVGKSMESSAFKNQIEYLLSRFEKTAIKNIIFLFTHSKDSLYRSGDAMPVLKKSLEELYCNSSVRVPFEKKNVFCIDSAAFQFLLTRREKFDFSDSENEAFKCSWKLSAEESNRLILYITSSGFKSLTSHRIQSSVVTNELRRFMRQLAESTIKIWLIVRDNSAVLEKLKHLLTSHKDEREQLMSKKYKPFINVRSKILNNFVLVCESPKCQETYNINGVNVVHYRQRCHNPCTCGGQLYSCTVFGNFTDTCSVCRCSKTAHASINSETELYADQQLDENVKSQILAKEQQLKDTKAAHNKSQERAKELKIEVKSFMQLIIRFEYLMNHLRITSCKGEYEEYLLGSKESLEKRADGDYYFQEMLELYKIEKNTVVECLQGSVVSAAAVQNLLFAVEEFHKLPNFGEFIKNSADTGRLKGALEQWLKTE